MKNCLYFTSAFGAGFFCWAVFAVNTALGADPHHVEEHVDEHMAEASHGAHGAADAAAHHASSAGMPQMDASTFPSQLFWLFVTFAILYVIFSKKSLPDISSVIENRQQHIESDLEHAEKLKEEAEQAEHEYEASLSGAREKATKALHDAQEKMKAKAEKQSEAFREKADKEIAALEKELAGAKKDAMDDMNTIAAEVASEAAKKIVGINLGVDQAKSVVEGLNNNGDKAKAA